MLISCPKCKFAANLKNSGRLSPDSLLLCPRCHTALPVPGAEAAAVSVRVKSEQIPWQLRSSWLDLGAFWKTSRAVLWRPAATFAALRSDGRLAGALAYALVYGSLGQVVGRYWFTLAGIHFGVLRADALANTMRFAATTLLTPLFLLLTLVGGAALVHPVLRLLGAARRSFSTTLQVMAYVSGGVSLLNFIPLVGTVVMPFWALLVNCAGLAAAHRISRFRALVALLLPLIVSVLLAVGLLMLLVAMGALQFLQRIHLPA